MSNSLVSYNSPCSYIAILPLCKMYKTLGYIKMESKIYVIA